MTENDMETSSARAARKEREERLQMLYDFNELEINRSCSGCTKCCSGILSGEAFGKKFHRGRPCHFVGKDGCTIYEDRPHSPCATYKCRWLTDKTLPEWLKPSVSNVIIEKRAKTDEEGKQHLFLRVTEVGQKIDSSILNWLIQYSMKENINIQVQVDNFFYYYGSEDFIKKGDTLKR